MCGFAAISIRFLQNQRTSGQVKCLKITNNANLKMFRWNERGLPESRLQRFKHFLCYSVPKGVILSETYWDDSSTHRFNPTTLLKRISIKEIFLPRVTLPIPWKSLQFHLIFSLNFGSSTKEEIVSFSLQTGHFFIEQVTLFGLLLWNFPYEFWLTLLNFRSWHQNWYINW